MRRFVADVSAVFAMSGAAIGAGTLQQADYATPVAGVEPVATQLANEPRAEQVSAVFGPKPSPLMHLAEFVMSSDDVHPDARAAAESAVSVMHKLVGEVIKVFGEQFGMASGASEADATPDQRTDVERFVSFVLHETMAGFLIGLIGFDPKKIGRDAGDRAHARIVKGLKDRLGWSRVAVAAPDATSHTERGSEVQPPSGTGHQAEITDTLAPASATPTIDQLRELLRDPEIRHEMAQTIAESAELVRHDVLADRGALESMADEMRDGVTGGLTDATGDPAGSRLLAEMFVDAAQTQLRGAQAAAPAAGAPRP